MQPKRLKALKLIDKLKIIEEVEAGAKKKEIARRYGLPPSTLSSILKMKPSILQFIESTGECSDFKRTKKPTYQRVNQAVFQWLKESKNNNLLPTGPVIQQKALELATELGEGNFKASTGWLYKFKHRYNLGEKRGNRVGREDSIVKEKESINESEHSFKTPKIQNKICNDKENNAGSCTTTTKSRAQKKNDQSNSNDSFPINEDIDIKSEILEFGPTEYQKSSLVSLADYEEDYHAIGTYIAEKLALLQRDQRTYALKFINDILNEADQGTLHSNSVELNRLPSNPAGTNSAVFTENSIQHDHRHHHDDDEESSCDIKPDITNLIPIPEFVEPAPSHTPLYISSTFATPSSVNPEISDDTKPDISRLAIPGTSAAALSIRPQWTETQVIFNPSRAIERACPPLAVLPRHLPKNVMPDDAVRLEWVNKTIASSLSLEKPYDMHRDHSYVRDKVGKSKTAQTDDVQSVKKFKSDFGTTASQIVVPARMPNNENVTFHIFEEKE